jgi:Cu/Ag efflux protein CusF
VKIAASCLTAVLLAAACAAQGATGSDPKAKAPAAAPPSMQRETLEELSASVTSVDAKTRIIGMKADDGTTGEYQAGPEVKNFAQIKVGDKVVVSYYRGLAATVLPAGTVVSKDVQQVDLATTAKAGEKPAAGIGSAVKATVVVQKADTKANTVTFTRPDGSTKTLPVKSDEGKAFLKKLKTGDKVDVVYAEAVAVEVREK